MEKDKCTHYDKLIGWLWEYPAQGIRECGYCKKQWALNPNYEWKEITKIEK